MTKRRKPRPGVRLTRKQLIDGLAGPSGTRIRLPRPEESQRVGELLHLATEDLEPEHMAAVATEQIATLLLDGMSGGAKSMIEPLVRAAAAGHLQQAALALSLPLAAQNKDGELVGALLALPPGMVVQTVEQAGYPQQALAAMVKYAKIKAVAVTEDARGQGLGAALIKRCAQIYWQLDYMLLFGEFDIERHLESYYTRQGFTVLEPGTTTDVGVVLTGWPIGLGAGPGEQLFFRWNRK